MFLPCKGEPGKSIVEDEVGDNDHGRIASLVACTHEGFVHWGVRASRCAHSRHVIHFLKESYTTDEMRKERPHVDVAIHFGKFPCSTVKLLTCLKLEI